MRSLWPSLRARLAQSIDTIGFQRSFKVMRRDAQELCRFKEPSGLLEFLHMHLGDLDEKDRVLACLIRAAKQRRAVSNDAMTLLWLAFWPGLDAIHWRCRRYFAKEPDELTSEIARHFGSVVTRFDAHRAPRVAATVLRNVERDLCAALHREWERAARIVNMPDDDPGDLHSGSIDSSRFGVPPTAEPEAAIAFLQRLLAEVIGHDAEMVIRIAILEESQKEAAVRLTLRADAARKRYQRACSRLRSHFDA
jgi:RNA polymerase sigma-70 factor (ECF subfamily)